MKAPLRYLLIATLFLTAPAISRGQGDNTTDAPLAGTNISELEGPGFRTPLNGYEEATIVEAEPPAFFIQNDLALPNPLPLDIPLQIRLRLFDSAKTPIKGSGFIKLGLHFNDGSLPSENLVVSPAYLAISDGIAQGSVKLVGKKSVENLFLAVETFTLNGHPYKDSVANAVRNVKKGFLVQPEHIFGPQTKLYNESANPSNEVEASLRHPLHKTVSITATFGEWRKFDIKSAASPWGRMHSGVDLRAEPGTPVYLLAPAKFIRGGPVKVGGRAAGQYLIFRHANGYFTNLLHVNPVPSLLPNVEYSDLDFKVASISDWLTPHLHFEMGRTESTSIRPPSFLKGDSNLINPLSLNERFSPQLINDTNNINTPKLEQLYFWSGNPKTEDFKLTGGGTTPKTLSKTVVAQIVDLESPLNGDFRKLAPAWISFMAEDPATGQLDLRDSFQFDKQSEVKRLFQDSKESFSTFGYVRRAGGLLPESSAYQFWFRWDTTAYKDYPTGPRSFKISAGDYGGRASHASFKFGPYLKLATRPSKRSSSKNFSVSLTSFLGPFPGKTAAPPTERVTVNVSVSPEKFNGHRWEVSLTDGEKQSISFDLTSSGASKATSEKKVIQIRAKFIISPFGVEDPIDSRAKIYITAESETWPGLKHQLVVPVSG